MTAEQVSAAQLVYTRIETEYSPVGTSGFQTVYRSDGLTPAQIAQIERRVRCFQPLDPETLRLQFFQLDDGSVVLSKSRVVVPWAAFRTVVDRQNRAGPFVAHCLVLSAEALRAVGGDPLALLHSEVFTPDLPALLERYGSPAEPGRAGVIPAVWLTPTPEAHTVATGWQGSDGRRLVMLALQAEALARAGRSVALIGASADIEATLRAALALLPFEQRLWCSFDTCIDRCSVAPGHYWAVGVRERPGGAAYIDVHAAQRRVVANAVPAAASSDLYTLWIEHVTEEHGSIDTAQQHARTIQLITRAMDRQRPLPEAAGNDPEGCREFVRVHAARIWERIDETLLAAVGSSVLADLVGDSIHASLKDSPARLLDAACQHNLVGFSLSTLLFQTLLEQQPELHEADWKHVAALAVREQHHGLQFLAATAHRPDRRAAADAVQHMPSKMYRELLRRLGASLAPTLFVGVPHTDELIAYLQETRRELSPSETADLYEAILLSGNPLPLDRLVDFVDRLDAQGCRRVQKLFEKYRPTTTFQRAIEAALAAKSTPGFFDRLLTFRRKRS